MIQHEHLSGIKMSYLQTPKTYIVLIFAIATALHGCGKSEEELNILMDTYDQGWWDALDCVKRKGGSAWAAAKDCEDE